MFLAAELDGTARTAYDLADRAVEALGGRVDVLVTNAATVQVAGTTDTDEAMLDAAWAVNVSRHRPSWWPGWPRPWPPTVGVP